MSEPQPEFTKTWHPFSHDEVRKAVERACEKLGWTIGAREYSIRPGSKCLAVYDITNGGAIKETDGIRNRIVWRNAIDMTHSLAFGSAYLELICSNLQLSETQSWVTFRKHTGRLSIEEITFYAEASLRTLIPKFAELQRWRENLRQARINYEQASMLTCFAMKRGYLPPSRFESFWDKFDGRDSLYKKDAMTLFAWQNANTELMKENNMLVQLDKQKLLHYFLKYEAPILLNQSNDPMKAIHTKLAIDTGFKTYQDDLATSKRAMKASSSNLREEWNEQQKAKKKKEKTEKEVKKIKKKAGKEKVDTSDGIASISLDPKVKVRFKDGTTYEENIKNALKEEREQKSKKKASVKKKSAPKTQRATTPETPKSKSTKKIKKSKTLHKCLKCKSTFDKKLHKKSCPQCGEDI
jgi:hypothetical protein